MSAVDGRLSGAGITLRILRDDLKTYAGLTSAPEGFNLANARAKLAAAPGLSAAEIAKAGAVNVPVSRSPREPNRAGAGWAIYNFPGSFVAYIARDDGTNLSYQAPQTIFKVADAVAALNATAGLTANELARIAAIY